MVKVNKVYRAILQPGKALNAISPFRLTETVVKNNKLDASHLKKMYPTINSVKAAIVELSSLLRRPAGTKIYIADLHAADAKYQHIINNCAGLVRHEINKVLPELTDNDKTILQKLVYYPHETLELLASRYLNYNEAMDDIVASNIHHLAKLIGYTGSKFSPEYNDEIKNASEFTSTIRTLVGNARKEDKIALVKDYVRINGHKELLIDLVDTFKKFLVFKVFIIGDIPDRGDGTAKIIDHCMNNKNIELEWGNHDILWMGASLGNKELICDVILNQLKYDTCKVLEKDYGIDLTPLRDFAKKAYPERPRGNFKTPAVLSGKYSADDLARMQKAVIVIAEKLQAARGGQIDSGRLNDIVDAGNGNPGLRINGTVYKLSDKLETVDLNNPSKLTAEEGKLIDYLKKTFIKSDRLQKHMKFIAEQGCLYHIMDGMLSYHAIVPVNDDGTLKPEKILGREYKGKELFDRLTAIYKEAFSQKEVKREVLDLFRMGWKGSNSITFGKSGMETFARALVPDKATWHEELSPYYRLLNDGEKCKRMVDNILMDFAGPGRSTDNMMIYNGHLPVKGIKEDIVDIGQVIKADSRVVCGDGSFSEGYGDVGIVFVSTSSGMYLYKLGKKSTVQEIIGDEGRDLVPNMIWKNEYQSAKQLGDCDIAEKIKMKIEALKSLLAEYEKGSNKN